MTGIYVKVNSETKLLEDLVPDEFTQVLKDWDRPALVRTIKMLAREVQFLSNPTFSVEDEDETRL